VWRKKEDNVYREKNASKSYPDKSLLFRIDKDSSNSKIKGKPPSLKMSKGAEKILLQRRYPNGQ
jgi:hypothetical protein